MKVTKNIKLDGKFVEASIEGEELYVCIKQNAYDEEGLLMLVSELNQVRKNYEDSIRHIKSDIPPVGPLPRQY